SSRPTTTTNPTRRAGHRRTRRATRPAITPGRSLDVWRRHHAPNWGTAHRVDPDIPPAWATSPSAHWFMHVSSLRS
ncbi:MAG: hypothetical protein OXG64_05080, partial [Chloroflexi bacterium]|nr:hypothetical protein [Chloroflexota bacterium]